ncbi:MAG: protease modulator HflC [Pirellulaceae bacterium]|nr:protease modulator HflC [Pirellulaceae bacterium]
MKIATYILATLSVLLLIAPAFVFIIDEREMGVVLRFGAPQRPAYTDPGVYFKLPLVDSVQRIPKIKQFWGDGKQDLLPDLPTKDDKKIELIPWAIWRVNDPIIFVQRLRTMEVAEQRVEQIVRSAIRDVITQYELEEIVRSTNRGLLISDVRTGGATEQLPAGIPAELIEQVTVSKPKNVRVGRLEILNRIKAEAHRRLASSGVDLGVDGEPAGRGIELIDVGISQLGFVDSVRRKTFDRWVAERQAISSKNINEGVRLKAAIINETKAEVAKIEGEGQQKASELRGKTDGEAIKRYADAIEKTGEFYSFVRTLEAYEKSIGPDSQLILSTESPFFKLFQDIGK